MQELVVPNHRNLDQYFNLF